MSVLIVGGKGNMGKRYGTILRYLNKDFRIADIDTPPDVMQAMAEESSGMIIATPTDTHTAYILSLSRLGKPILCEKPLCKDVEELETVLGEVKENGAPFSMVYQYGMLVDHKQRGETFYDYFRHGNDGLVWDCIQIVGLATGELRLEEKSPIWRCVINGERLDIGAMDYAYVQFMQAWFKNPEQDISALIDIHVKTAEIDRGYQENGRLH